MEIAPTTTSTTTITNTNTNNNTNIPTTKSPDQETETPIRIQQPKPLSFTNGVLKRHNNPSTGHHHHLTVSPRVVITYKECLKNHAATLGGHALDGCGEFMPSPTATHTDPTSLKCAACGCHRNFHRREPEDSPPPPPHVHQANTTTTIEYQPHHRHHPPPPPPPQAYRSPNSASPPPISSAYPSAPHMLLALSGGVNDNSGVTIAGSGSSGRKRFRTKFSQSQKEKMQEFAERVGWKMQKRDEELVQEFCNEVGVDKGVLKVWMHNNKNTFAKRDANGSNGSRSNLEQNMNHNNNNNNITSDNNVNHNHHHHHLQQEHSHFGNHDNVAHVATTNGSSSSS